MFTKKSSKAWLREIVCSVFLHLTFFLVKSSQNPEVSVCYPVSLRMVSCISHNLAGSNHEGHFSQLGWVKSCGLRFLKNYKKGPFVSHCCWNVYSSITFAHTHSPGSAV